MLKPVYPLACINRVSEDVQMDVFTSVKLAQNVQNIKVKINVNQINMDKSPFL